MGKAKLPNSTQMALRVKKWELLVVPTELFDISMYTHMRRKDADRYRGPTVLGAVIGGGISPF